MIQLRIFNQSETRIPRKKILELAENVMKMETEPGAQGRINLVLTNDREIRKLNKRFRNRNRSTDVLSFIIDPPNNKKSVLGEIYISVVTAKRQATEYCTNLNSEILQLFCHGLLHLFGYDHAKRNDRLKMEKRERYFLKPK